MKPMHEIAPTQYNFKIIDFSVICHEIFNSVVTDANVYDLFKNNRFSRDLKRLLLHYTILHTCNYLLKGRGKTPVVLYFQLHGYESKFHEIFEKGVVDRQLNQDIKKLKKLLPIRIYIGDKPFDKIKNEISSGSGEGIEFLRNVKVYIDGIETHAFTFSKIRSFVKRNELTFLTSDYFNQIKTKQLLFT
jgi:hypothetical protein